MNRARLVRELAPVAPPCFAARDQWLSFLEADAIHQRVEHTAGPLLFVKDEPVRFDPSYSWCHDCTMEFRSRMLKAGNCDPSFLRKLAFDQAQQVTT